MTEDQLLEVQSFVLDATGLKPPVSAMLDSLRVVQNFLEACSLDLCPVSVLVGHLLTVGQLKADAYLPNDEGVGSDEIH